MATPPLPLLRQLLYALRIPVLPSSLAATPPSLLLIILESIIGSRLPLPYPMRQCQTYKDELAVIKCILGVLADDILGMDLSVIDPARVVQGVEQEMAVVVMALVAAAKRNGIAITLPPYESRGSLDDAQSLLGDSSSPPRNLPPPILPDASRVSGPFSSPLLSQVGDISDDDCARHTIMTVFDDSYEDQRASEAAEIDRPIFQKSQQFLFASEGRSLDTYSTPEPKSRTSFHAHSNDYLPSIHAHQSDSQLSTESSGSGRTVLQHMLDDFGFDLGR